jgi:hypothetical protein
VPYVFVYDKALNKGEKRLSLRGADATIERAPEITWQSNFADAVPPVLDIGVCKGTDSAERCLRITAAPTNPGNPNGETVVDVYYWAFEEGPLSTSSGFNEGYLQLRDPTGKIFGYYLMEGAVGAVGVTGRSPKRWRDGNYSFSCPSQAPASCDATTPVQYQARIILPAGSAPGTWGLFGFSVGDKVENYRGYDFTELFRFTPSGTGDDERVGAASESGGNPFTFEVAGAGSKPASLTTVMVSTVKSAWSSAVDTVSAWLSRAGAYVLNGVSRAMAWSQGSARAGVELVRNELASLGVSGRAGAKSSVSDGSGERAVSAESVTVSVTEDPQTGSRYQIIRQQSDDKESPQRWTLEYRSNTGALFSSARLPDTSEVLWRGSKGSSELSTTGWTRVCADRVWSVQDGYQMLFTLADRSLSDVRPGQLWVNSQAEVTVISDVRCAFGGSVWVEGYAFAASDKEPLLRGQRVETSRFGFALDRLGGLSKRQVEPAFFEAPKHCAEPANEQLLFCSEVKTAVGW